MNEVPVLYLIERETDHASGVVFPFCSQECLEVAARSGDLEQEGFYLTQGINPANCFCVGSACTNCMKPLEESRDEALGR